MKKLLLILVVIILSTFSLAADRVAADPMVMAIGSRAEAMGGTGVSFLNNSQAIFINPALIRNKDAMNMSLYTNKYFGEFDYLSASTYFKLDKRTIGLGIVSNTLSDIPKTSVIQEGNDFRIFQDGNYEVSDKAFLAAYAFGLDNFLIFRDLSLGMNFKLANQTVDSSSLSGFGFDAGVLFELGGWFSGYKFGGAILNLVPPSFSSGEGGETSAYEIKTVMGISNTFILGGRELLAAFEMDTLDGMHMGGEYRLTDTFYLRGGIDGSNMTYGLGLKMYSDQENPNLSTLVEFDYAYHKFENPLKDMHMFTISFFGLPELKAPKIAFPTDRYVTTADRVSVRGYAEAGTDVSVFVNDKLRSFVKTDGNGRWQINNVYLDDGRNELYALCVNGDRELRSKETILVMADRSVPVVTDVKVLREGLELFITANVSKRVKNVYFKEPGGKIVQLDYNRKMKSWSTKWKIPANIINKSYDLKIIAMDFTNKKSKTFKKTFSLKLLKKPKDRSVVESGVIDVVGVGENFVQSLIVNGEVVESKNGKFKVKVTLADPGKNLVNISAKLTNGSQVDMSTRVLNIITASDIETYFVEKDNIKSLLTLGLMDVVDGKFDPKATLTITEFVEILAKVKKVSFAQAREYVDVADGTAAVKKIDVVSALVKMENFPKDEETGGSMLPFSDITEKSELYPVVSLAYNKGIVSIDSDKFNANKVLKRSEFAMLLANSPTVAAMIRNLYDWKSGYKPKEMTAIEAVPTANTAN